MLKEIMAAWSDGSIMRDAVNKLGQMVADVEYVFSHAWETCLGQTVADQIADAVREHDKAVNRGEREIRRVLTEHLTVNPGRDVSGCLALLIMAKDTERLGDHARNIFDLGVGMKGGAQDLKLFGVIKPIAEKSASMLPKLQRSILDSDEALAHQLLEEYQAVKQEIKTLMKALPDTEMPAREAIVTTLFTRYLKRANAHLGNVASGVIFPLENIDFVSRGLRQEEKDR